MSARTAPSTCLVLRRCVLLRCLGWCQAVAILLPQPPSSWDNSCGPPQDHLPEATGSLKGQGSLGHSQCITAEWVEARLPWEGHTPGALGGSQNDSLFRPVLQVES